MQYKTIVMEFLEQQGVGLVYGGTALRSDGTMQTIDAGNPAHVVAKWIGHSVKVQNDNYAQVDDHQFDQFNSRAVPVQNGVESDADGKNCPSPSNVDDAEGHRQGRKASGVTTTRQRRKDKNPAKLNVLRGSSENFGSLRFAQVPEAGVELTVFYQQKRHFLKSQGHRQGQLILNLMRRGN